jgi:hypothetical protein
MGYLPGCFRSNQLVYDIPGRLIGREIGIDAFQYAEQYFNVAPISSVNEDLEAANFVQVYPNPTRDQVYLKSEVGYEINYTLYNQLGQAVLSKERLFVQSGRSIDLHQLPAGVYWLQVRDLNTNTQQVEQIIKTF